MQSKFTSVTTKEVAGVSGRDPWEPIESKAPLKAAISQLSSWDLHRIPVLDGGGELTSLLTQSRICGFVSSHLSQFPVAQKTVAEVGIGAQGVSPTHTFFYDPECQVITARLDDSALSAFRTLKNSRVSGSQSFLLVHVYR